MTGSSSCDTDAPHRTAEKSQITGGLPATMGEATQAREEEQVTTPFPQDEEDNIGLFSKVNFMVAIPTILIPIVYGYQIGYVGPYATMYSYATNCDLYKSQTSCETVTAAKCKWFQPSVGSNYVCGWADRTTCSLTYTDLESCSSDSVCVWSYADKTCGNQVGYTSIINGLFAGSMIMGTTVGSVLGGILTKNLDYRKSFLLIGIIIVIGQILTHVATGIFQYWLLFAARIIMGFAMGWQSVAAPHYTDVFSPKKHQKTLGTLFQVFTAFGSFITAIFGLCLGNTINYEAERDANLMGRMQGLTVLPTLLAIGVCFLPLVTKDGYSVVAAKKGDDAQDKYADADGGAAPKTGVKPSKGYTSAQMIGPILLGATMAATLQLTGINANMNFGPTILSNLGLDPLVGNIIMMAWNSITAFGVIPLSRRFSMRTLFLFFSLVGSLCCLFLGGIPVYPGVTQVLLAKQIIAIVGIFLFIAAYEFGIGPCFFVLTVDVFPRAFRPIGSSITTCIMFALNLIINICYPIATEGISGGPAGDQDKGQAVAFIFFGCVGLVTVVIEYFFLYPWEENSSNVANAPIADNIHDDEARELEERELKNIVTAVEAQ